MFSHTEPVYILYVQENTEETTPEAADQAEGGAKGEPQVCSNIYLYFRYADLI